MQQSWGSKPWLAACAALALIAGAGCRRSDCVAPRAVSGTWSGDARDQAGGRFAIQLALSQTGDAIAGSYTAGNVTGDLYGVRIGRRVEFDTEPPAACGSRLRGVVRFCGESADLTLDGDCNGAPFHATATLRRTSNAAPIAGSSGRAPGGGGGGAGAPGAGTGSPAAGSGAAGRSPQPPPCAYRDNGRCDEPQGSGLCPEGTDEVDCNRTVRPCAYQNDGACDEPEGTGLCDEGQDAADCRPGEICGSRVCTVPGAIDEALGETVSTCCAGSSRCGLSIGSGTCFEVTPGVANAACGRALAPLVPAPLVPVNLPGCCRSDGLCGLAPQSIDLGCILPESLNLAPAGSYRIDCGGATDADAGAAESAQSAGGG